MLPFQIAKRAYAVRQLIASKVTPRVLLPAIFAAYAALTADDATFSEVWRTGPSHARSPAGTPPDSPTLAPSLPNQRSGIAGRLL